MITCLVFAATSARCGIVRANLPLRLIPASAAAQGPQGEVLLEAFYNKWAGDPLVVNKWLGLQAASNTEGNIERVKGLLDHPGFDINNPNKVYSLLGGFCSSSVNFHAADGSGYEFLADMILKLDALNAQVRTWILPKNGTADLQGWEGPRFL